MFDLSMVIAFVISILALSMFGWLAVKLKIENKKKVAETDAVTKQIEMLTEKLQKVISQKKSSEVRLGKIGENMAPFFQLWPYAPNKFRFLGDPVDGISFNEDEIVFVEIKTGKARLTTSQKRAKELIKEGKVKFATFRVGEDGCSLKVEDE
jgi:predicted Holliday junction resolvase-like endonuclease